MLFPSLAALAAGAALFSRPAFASPASSAYAALQKAAGHKFAATNNPNDPTVFMLEMSLKEPANEFAGSDEALTVSHPSRNSITEPACGFYRCTVTWPIGSKVDVNWLGPPPGNVSVSLASNIGGPTYVIAPNVPATSQEGYCDAGYGLGVVAPGHECGRVEFVVPDGWKQMTNYTIVVQSLSDSSLAGYTDMINITSPNASSPSAVPSAQIPSGTVASLVSIPAPTSTDLGASVAYTGKIPAPTAVTGAPSPSASSAASSAVKSSQSGSSSLLVMSLSSTRASGGSSASGGAAAQSAGTSGSRTSAASAPSQTGGAAGPLVKKTGAALALVACTVAYFF
ncbi:secreted protein [Rhodotorula toruloides]|uniref:Secreted protein n=1 Tax=Rhodotorula toruloides TaxID=5286 RepID=A0A511KNN3_RHOTO|nr:secreted protein [Rhodotorula toruloides]